MSGQHQEQQQQEEEGWTVKFVPFASAVDSPFWVRYCREKLETICLSEDPIDFRPTYGCSYSGTTPGAATATTNTHPRLQCQESSLHATSTAPVAAAAPTSSAPNERVYVSGKLIGFNTLESFQKVDKNKILYDRFCPEFFDEDERARGGAKKNSTDVLASAVLLTYADLKNHRVLYWFGIPALMTKPGKSIRALRHEKFADFCDNGAGENGEPLATQIEFMRRSLAMDGHRGLPPYFIFSSQSCLPLSVESYSAVKAESDGDAGVIFGFFDPSSAATAGESSSSTKEQPAMGWPMRNLVAYMCFHLDLGGETVKILSYRPQGLRRLSVDDKQHSTAPGSAQHDSDSILLTVKVPLKGDYKFEGSKSTDDAQYKVVGWELNARSKPGPRWVNLRPLLDASHLAIQAADLNLKLMKWRMIPELQVGRLQSTKVLLIGAGTLGCNVSRVLLGWGIRNFKIVDNGRVSYSNPVRQSLFTLEDCRDESGGGGKPKAVAAAESLRTIAADVTSEGIVLSIPMPGHPESQEAIEESVQRLDALVRECDVVFLLTDTRESRWLPTVMAAAHDKMLINAALGLDSWLVMRHGGGGESSSSDCPQHRLGCYFCNDVVAPENSTRNRTLDQQCTVTRPGLAPIASSMAVELMVSMLHHPRGVSAPAPAASASGTSNFSPVVPGGDSSSASASPLGVIPHQIRGSLVSYTMMTPTVPAFIHCTGCSGAVVLAYLKDKAELVLETCRSTDGSYLEDISGLTDFRAEAVGKFADAGDWEEDE